MLIALPLLAVALVVAFVQAAQAGWLGERSKYQVAKDSTDPVSILVNTRPEVLQGFYLVSLRPCHLRRRSPPPSGQ
jgi:hypothetical protein